MATGRVCAGQQQNGKQDCAIFRNRLKAKYGNSNVQSFGEDSTLATEANYTGGKNNDVMYWSSHGLLIDGYSLVGDTRFPVARAMSGWSSSNALQVLIIAACNAMHTSDLRVAWANMLRSSNIRAFAGYGNTAPAGSDTDVRIAKRFFNNLDDGKCVWKAWKAGNQITSTAKNSWGVIQYGETTANKNYKMPGWGSNSGATRDTNIYLLKQSGHSVINTGRIALSEMPFSIQVGTSLIPLEWDTLGSGQSSEVDGITCLEYRDDVDTTLTTDVFQAYVQKAIHTLGIDALVKDTHIEQTSITIAEITDTGEKDERVIGCDMIYQQQYMGIPLHDNFVRICVDADGVYCVINGWHPIAHKSVSLSDKRVKSLLKVEDAIEKAGIHNPTVIEEQTYMYVDRGDGIYTLCHSIIFQDGRAFLLDAQTGEIK